MVVPVFSIATPTRNSIDKLKRCVGSVRGQTEVSLEHLIQDANSSDGTPEWLADQNGIEAVSQADSGMYDAINRAWSRSRGDYLSWLNSDEQYLPGTLFAVQKFFELNPTVDIVYGNYIVANLDGKPIALRREIPFRLAYVTNGFLNMQSATIFFRRRLLDRGLLILDSKYRYAADKELILRLAASGCVIAHIPKYLSIFGIDGTNLSTHQQMEIEAEKIRIAFGGMRYRPLRKLVMVGRSLERLIRGAYWRTPITYRYARNEIPQYLEISADKLGGRYTLQDISTATVSVREV
jgi:glycosyltransferase involved in cell wall biosynthesis